MTSAAIDYTYRYPFASELSASGSDQLNVSLATCDARLEHPHFFRGRVLQPRQFAQMLLVLSEVVRTHFFLPRPALLDPVVTSSPETLRLEGFSGCCGVYARVDMQANAFDGEILGRGTTNVDFNDPMRGALNRIRDNHEIQFNVGRDAVELETTHQKIVEKKVKLPIRWIKGFSEVQAYLPGLQPRLEVNGAEAIKFFRSLPKAGPPKQKTWVVPLGKSLRLTQRAGKNAVAFMGTHRVRVLEPLFHESGSLRVYDDPETGVSAWEYRSQAARFMLLLSPEVYRGFSGEGQILKQLSQTDWQGILDEVQSHLSDEQTVDLDQISDKLNCDRAAVSAALAVLGSRGLAGFDLNSETYYYREMPFDLSEVEKLQPRLKGARKLVEGGGITVSKRYPHDDAEAEYDLSVPGSGVQHFVRLRNDGDRCSCPWFSKYEGQRGPCKHILAARIVIDEGEGS